MIKPYYSTKLGDLYLGSYLDIMPEIKKVDIIITDPPYKIHAKSGGGLHNNRNWLHNVANAELDEFNPTVFLSKLKQYCNHAYIFSSKNLLKEYIAWLDINNLSWDLIIMSKNNPIPTKNNKYLSDKEYCFFIRGKDCYFNNNLSYDFFRSVKKVSVTPNTYHPCQKDIGFINELLMISTKPEHVVLDLFAGSGTTGIACERLNRRYILIEKEEQYAEIAAKRIEAEASQLKLF